MLNLGLHVYDAFSGFKEKHENIGRQTTLDRYPLLQDQNLTGAIVYADAFAEDYRLVIEIVKSAHRAGAECLNRVAAVAFNASGDHHEIRVQDRLSGEEKVLRSRTVINCAGPFSDQIRRLLGLSEKLYLTQGVHFLVPRTKLPIHEAYVINDPHHDRILFAIPWKTTTYLGTTDTPIQKASDAQARAEDLDYVLRLANQFFNLEIRKADVFQSWAAVRPLIKPSTVESASKVSREHEILEEPNGFFHILGGKLTSHREMAEEALDLMQKFFPQARQCSTKELPLQDQEYYGELGDLEQRFGRYAQDVWEWDREKKLDRMRISQSHPVRAAEIYYAIHHEMAIEPIDFLRRRSSLYYETSEPKILEAVISVFKKELAKPEEWARNKMKETLSAYDWDSSGWH
jgi:glycerol-3-phosphate dehydrogenase